MTQAILERAIAKAGTTVALAELLGQKRNAISNWRAGRPIPDDVLAYLAEYVGEDPLQVLATEKGGMWSKLRAAAVTAALVAVLVPISPPSSAAVGGQLVIMSTRLRAWLRWFYTSNLVRLRTIAPHAGHLLGSPSNATSSSARP